jgi:hypothetical protein
MQLKSITMKISKEKMPYFSAYPLKAAIGPSGQDVSQSLLRIADTAKKVIRVRVLPMSLSGKTIPPQSQDNPSSNEAPDNDDSKDWFKNYE